MRERAFHPESVRSILVLRLYFIGDVLLSTPVLEALKNAFPNATTSVMVKSRAAAVLLGNPHVDETLVYDGVPNYHSARWVLGLARELRRRRFSLAVDLTGDLRSSWMLLAGDPAFRVGFNHARMEFLLDRRIEYLSTGHVVDHLLTAVEPLGATATSRKPRLYLSDEERDAARSLLSSAGVDEAEGTVVLSPGANWEHRRWSPARFGAVAAHARERLGLAPVVIGSKGDMGLAEEVVSASGGAAVSLAGRTDLRELAAVAERASVFVGNDSGPMHVAAAVGTPVVALFGPNTPERFAPRVVPSVVLTKDFECSPCAQRSCVRPEDDCMSAIGVDEVTGAMERLLAEGGRR